VQTCALPISSPTWPLPRVSIPYTWPKQSNTNPAARTLVGDNRPDFRITVPIGVGRPSPLGRRAPTSGSVAGHVLQAPGVVPSARVLNDPVLVQDWHPVARE